MAIEKKEKRISVDDQFLRDLVARGNVKVSTPTGQPVDKENLDQFLAEVGDSGNPDTTTQRDDSRVKKLQERAERLNAANQARIDKEQEKIDARRRAIAEKTREESISTTQGRISRTAETVSSNIAPVADHVGSLPTTGGIGLLLAILVLLLFVVVQVNSQGDTRLKQLWYMLNGRTTLQGRATIAGYGGGASGTFGPDTSGSTSSTTSSVPTSNVSDFTTYRSISF